MALTFSKLKTSKVDATAVSTAPRSLNRQPKFVALTAVFLYAISWAVVLVAGVTLPGLADPMCFGLLEEKHRILDNARSPKIVFVGGSNLLFGIDGQQIGASLHRPVVNMGLCLMFPLAYILDEIKDNVHAGDVIVLSPEYADFSEEYANKLAVVDILDPYPQAITWILRSNCLKPSELLVLFDHVRHLGLQKLDYASRHLAQIFQGRCRWTHSKYNPGLDVLNKSNIDSCGDLTWHLKQKNNNSPSPAPFLVSGHVDAREASDLNNFQRFCENRGARFVMIPPSVSDKQYAGQAKLIDKLMKDCKLKVSVPWVAPPQRYAFPEKMIFNAQYHLNNIGRPIRSQMIVDDLRSVVDRASKAI